MIDLDSGIPLFFKKLGYKVDWDGRMDKEQFWYEILDPISEKIIAQIDLGTPINSMIEDMSLWTEGKEGISDDSYIISGFLENPSFQELLQKVKHFNDLRKIAAK